MPSHTLAKIEYKDLDIIGYSVAGEETVVAVPRLDVCFDIGKAPDQVISINHVLLTHGHMDHAAGIAYYLSHRHFDGQTPGTVLAPQPLIDPIQHILDHWGTLDGNPIPSRLIGLEDGQEFPIKPNLFVHAFATDHCQSSMGYTVFERRMKLKPEYATLKGPEIVELKRQGLTINHPLDIPIVTYLGDIPYTDFSASEKIANSKILITECTFFKEEHIDRAKAGRHLHVQDLERLLENLNNERIVLIHATQRTGMKENKQILKAHLSQKWHDRVVLLMDHRSRRK